MNINWPRPVAELAVRVEPAVVPVGQARVVVAQQAPAALVLRVLAQLELELPEGPAQLAPEQAVPPAARELALQAPERVELTALVVQAAGRVQLAVRVERQTVPVRR